MKKRTKEQSALYKKLKKQIELDASPPIPTLCSSTKDWGTIMENLEKGIEDDENEL